VTLRQCLRAGKRAALVVVVLLLLLVAVVVVGDFRDLPPGHRAFRAPCIGTACKRKSQASSQKLHHEVNVLPILVLS
jgi:hypothetical protein